MSRLAPDIPELEPVPHAARSLVYLAALNSTIRSPVTWIAGALVFAAGVGAGAVQGTALFGRGGGAAGAAAGALASVWCFYKAILPWRARRVLPSVIEHADRRTLGDVQRADAEFKRMIDAYNRREVRKAGEGTDLPPRRLP